MVARPKPVLVAELLNDAPQAEQKPERCRTLPAPMFQPLEVVILALPPQYGQTDGSEPETITWGP